MKKIVSLLLSITLMLTLAMPAFAADMAVTLTPSASEVKAGDTFTVCAKLSGAPDASSVGVTVGLPDGVEFVSGEWLYTDALLKTFDPANMVGAAAFNGAHSPNGDAFRLTLKTKENTTAAQAVQIGIKLKNGSADVGSKTETATIDIKSGTSGETVEPNDYTVVLKDDATLAVGETAVVSVMVKGGKYNAIDMKLTYDSSCVELSTTTLKGLTLTKPDDNTVRVQGYGSDHPSGSTAFSLNFKALAPGETVIGFLSAKVDAAAHAVAADAPDAAWNKDVTLTIGGYPVELSDDFTGPGTAEKGKSYTFTARDKNYDYDFTGSTMGGKAVTVIDNGNGTFTIENVSGEIRITDERTPKTFDVSISGSGKNDVTADNTASYGTGYTFTVNKAASSNYTVTVTVGGKNYTGFTVSGNSYSIPGSDITGEIAISVTKTAQSSGSTTVTISGVPADEVEGGLTQTAEIGKPFTFTINKKPGYDYEVKAGNTVYTQTADGSYTIPGSQVTSGGLNITVTKVPSADTLNVYEYVRLDGRMMYLLTYTNTPGTGKVPTYNGNNMFWSAKYNAWSTLVIDDDEMADTIKVSAMDKLGEAAADKVGISYEGDVNATGVVDINDAQLVWNMYNARHNDFSDVSMEKFLRGDINGDHKLDTQDAVAVVSKIK